MCLTTLIAKHKMLEKQAKRGKQRVALVLADGQDPGDGAIAWGGESDDEVSVGEDSDVDEASVAPIPEGGPENPEDEEEVTDAQKGGIVGV